MFQHNRVRLRNIKRILLVAFLTNHYFIKVKYLQTFMKHLKNHPQIIKHMTLIMFKNKQFYLLEMITVKLNLMKERIEIKRIVLLTFLK
jgi:hypothetical protein